VCPWQALGRACYPELQSRCRRRVSETRARSGFRHLGECPVPLRACMVLQCITHTPHQVPSSAARSKTSNINTECEQWLDRRVIKQRRDSGLRAAVSFLLFPVLAYTAVDRSSRCRLAHSHLSLSLLSSQVLNVYENPRYARLSRAARGQHSHEHSIRAASLLTLPADTHRP
jgi:hypothetical protein